MDRAVGVSRLGRAVRGGLEGAGREPPVVDTFVYGLGVLLNCPPATSRASVSLHADQLQRAVNAHLGQQSLDLGSAVDGDQTTARRSCACRRRAPVARCAESIEGQLVQVDDRDGAFAVRERHAVPGPVCRRPRPSRARRRRRGVTTPAADVVTAAAKIGPGRRLSRPLQRGTHVEDSLPLWSRVGRGETPEVR